tara:strand:- start:72 stop:230 length:159 start_codon:yes stop_codon:yes gene_type:complete
MELRYCLYWPQAVLSVILPKRREDDIRGSVRQPVSGKNLADLIPAFASSGPN